MSEKKYKEKDWLEEKIYGENLLQHEVAKEIGVSQQTIGRWMNKHDIPKRSNQERQRLKVDERLRNKDWLVDKYKEENKDISDIASICDVGRGTVCRWLQRHEIETRKKGTGFNIDWETLNNKKKMFEMYVENNLTLLEISEKCNCSRNTVSSKLKEHDIEVDKRGSVFGKRNGNYKHGNKTVEHLFGNDWDEIRKEILERDNYECQCCEARDYMVETLYNTSLCVHHIVPRYKFADSDGKIDFEEANKRRNLITLCPRCHGKVERSDKIKNKKYPEFNEELRKIEDYTETEIIQI
jgi:5-methylcytosine-specific restriction endonuclease McrA/transposase